MHDHYMKQAIAIAEKGKYIAPPNPWVGCVIVKNKEIVGQGFTQPPGKAHAEIEALEQAREQAKDASMYVSLEPCSHYGRTPPCTNAIIRSGIKEVYVAQLDPDVRVSGKGINQLEEAGIKVTIGICEEEARAALTAYLYQRKTGLPYTIIKTATSIDGRTAAADTTSQWITSVEARQDVHRLRAECQAVVIGSGTAIKDLPKLTVRHDEIHLNHQPLRVLLDTSGRVPAEGPLFDSTLAPTLILTTDRCTNQRKHEWERSGAEVITLPGSDKIDLISAWKLLGSRGILQTLIEGGSTLQTSIIKAGLFNRLTVYMGSMLLGANGLPFFLGNISSISDADKFKLVDVKSFGDTIRINYERGAG